METIDIAFADALEPGDLIRLDNQKEFRILEIREGSDNQRVYFKVEPLNDLDEDDDLDLWWDTQVEILGYPS